MGESLKGNRNSSVHPVVKINYKVRISIAIIGIIGVSTVLYFLHVERYIQKFLVVFIIWISWPHLAYRLSINSKDPEKVEKRNVLFDFLLAGFLLCVLEFNFWLSFAATIIVVGNAIMVGGFRFFLKSIAFFIFGPLVGFLLFGIDINQEYHFWVTVVGVVGILSYVAILSTASYTQTQQRIQAKKQVKLKNQQLHNLSKKLSEFLPSQLVDNIADGQIESVSTHHRKKLTLFFSDIKDFTKMTDALEPEDMAKIINHTTWVLVNDDIPCLEKGQIEIKGYHLPIKVYEVEAT